MAEKTGADQAAAPTIRMLDTPRRSATRTDWAWLAAASVLVAMLAGGTAMVVHGLLPSRDDDASRPADQAQASPAPEQGPAAPVPQTRAAKDADDPGGPWSQVPPLERPWGAVSQPSQTPDPPRAPTPLPPVPTGRDAPAVQRPGAEPRPAAGLSPAGSEAPGFLRLDITPWALVTIDDADVGTTPLRPIPLASGRHSVRLTHPDYQPLQRKLQIRSGETTRLEIDLAWEAVAK
jgi:hypothetical protein